MSKRIVAMLLCVIMLTGSFGTNVSAAKTVTQTQVEDQLTNLIAQYEGAPYVDSFNGATQCKGFADMIYDTLFGVGSIGNYPREIYHYLNLNYGVNTREVGRIEPGYTLTREGVAKVKALLSQALPGDYIQMGRPGYGHSMIVVDTSDTGITVLHANWSKILVGGKEVPQITVTTFTWESLANKSSGISLYHYKNYLAAGEYTDVPKGTWYHSYVQYVSQMGLMNGTGATTFGPGAPMTRSMVVTVLYRMSQDTGEYPMSFADVPTGRFYTAAVGWAAAKGITTGYTDGLFHPDDTITRAQLALFLYRFAQLQGYDTSASADLQQFTDAAQIPRYAAAALQWAAGEEIFQGSGGMLRPVNSASRCEVAKVLTVFHRLLNQPVQAAACGAEPAPAPAAEGLPALQQELALLLCEENGVWSVYLKELSTGETVYMNESPMPAGDWIEWFDTTDGYPMTAAAGVGGPDVALTSAGDFGQLLETACDESLQLVGEANAAWVVPGEYILCVMSDGAGDVADVMAQIHALTAEALGD